MRHLLRKLEKFVKIQLRTFILADARDADMAWGFPLGSKRPSSQP